MTCGSSAGARSLPRSAVLPCLSLALLLHLVTGQAHGGSPGGGGGSTGGGYRSAGGGYGSGYHYNKGYYGGGNFLTLTQAIVFIVLVLAAVILYACALSAWNLRRESQEARRFLGEAEGATQQADVDLPSGIWRGYYSQFGNQHQLADFNLVIDKESRKITGQGVDDIGTYSFQGMVSADGQRVAFRKQYVFKSPALDGQVNMDMNMNMGHMIEYRGERAGSSLGLGIKGNWHISGMAMSGNSNQSGGFHLWPAMEGWRQPQASTAFYVTEDNICIVCFDHPIDTCLQPCGHAAVCKTCVEPLNPRRCPICRFPIFEVQAARSPPAAPSERAIGRQLGGTSLPRVC